MLVSTRRGVAVVVGIFLLAGAAVAVQAKVKRTSPSLAARLAARDPGAHVDGTTIVGTGNGQTLRGVPNRPNFIAGLGSHETIVGGNRNDNLAALGDDATIIARGGNDVVYGGRGATLVGGAGHDMLIDTQPGATIKVTGSNTEVAATGHHDRVICSARIHGDVIYAGASVSISASCRRDHARVLPASRLRVPQRGLRATAITGDGSNDHPFVAPCDDPTQDDCTVSAFPARTLTTAWQNEHVPAYECPEDHPYLFYKGYAPFGTEIPSGVEIVEASWAWAIGISISGTLTREDKTFVFFSGTATGDAASSATNSLFDGTNSYRVVLHCTSIRCHGTDLRGPPPDCSSGGAVGDRARAHRQARRT
jgi:hypothetical protein